MKVRNKNFFLHVFDKEYTFKNVTIAYVAKIMIKNKKIVFFNIRAYKNDLKKY
jgi:hypothetical protein